MALDLSRIDRKYGIVIERSRSVLVREYDEENLVEEEWEDIEIEISYKVQGRLRRRILPLQWFVSIYRTAKPMVRKSKRYIHYGLGPEEFDVIEYLESVIREEQEKIGPMFG